MRRRGNCYVSSEALYHILGGSKTGWKVMRLRTDVDTHWYLQHRHYGIILDPSRIQFRKRKCKWTDRWTPDYSKGICTGFLTKKPSKRAKKLMKQLTWQEG